MRGKCIECYHIFACLSIYCYFAGFENLITNFNPKYTSIELEQISHSFYTHYTGNGDGVRICMYKPYTAFRECVLISQLT